MFTMVRENDCLSYAQVFEWHKRLSEDRENVEDGERTKPPSSRTEENIEKDYSKRPQTHCSNDN